MPSRLLCQPRAGSLPNSIRPFSSQTPSRAQILPYRTPSNPCRQASLHTSAPRRVELESASPASIAHSLREPVFQSTPSADSSDKARTILPQVGDLSRPLVISKSLQELLPALHSQKPHYITAHIHSFPYLLTEGDTLRLPFHMHGVNPGDILNLDTASILGSRDYTLKAGLNGMLAHGNVPHVRGEKYINKKRTGEQPYLDERLFTCRVRVTGLESTPMSVMEKKKRRNRRTRKVMSKHRYTLLKVMEVKVKSLDQLMAETKLMGEEVILE